MLKLEEKQKIFYGEEEIEVKDYKKLEDFFIANLSMKVSFGSDLKLDDLINHLSELSGFIEKYFSEQFDKVRAVVFSTRNHKNYVGIKFFKKLIIEEGRLYIQPSYDFIADKNSNVIRYNYLSQLPVFIDENIVLIEEVKGEFFNNSVLKNDITLIDVAECLFVDMIYDLTEGYKG